MTNTPLPDAEEFASVLVSHGAGLAHDEATEQLKKAIQAVKDTGKPASVKVELKITPLKRVRDTIQIESNVTANIPEEPLTSIWYTDNNNGLHRNDPKQLSMWATDNKTTAAGKDN